MLQVKILRFGNIIFLFKSHNLKVSKLNRDLSVCPTPKRDRERDRERGTCYQTMGYEGASSQFKTLSIATKATAKQLFLAE